MSIILADSRQLFWPLLDISKGSLFSGLLPEAVCLNFENDRMMNQAIDGSDGHG
jgi:hypothetical protein